ncbi:hypothetical protein [Steroidobacter sp.]|uniref:hypothetical protein n=1 Tax=Steroidobacter sp. TaxID=1978227 RepID=UPI001A428758|nr:hypothetical protein [Steroidobacter sp.]MBL8270456.1 hypothetical protein [Steroidobacter sp.]
MVAATMEPEFAPQYSPQERRRLQILYGVLSILMFGALYWAVPRFRLLAIDAPCVTLFGIPGSTLLLYGALVGAPLVGAVLMVAMTARSSIYSIATRRYPPPGQKVFGRVKVKRGRQAVALALMPAMLVTLICLLSAQGMAVATRMSREVRQSAVCANDSERITPEAKSERRPTAPSDPEHQRPTR